MNLLPNLNAIQDYVGKVVFLFSIVLIGSNNFGNGSKKKASWKTGPVLYLNSYFICHHTYRRQDGGRPLRFDRGINDCEGDIRFAWEDMVNMNLPIFLCDIRSLPSL